MKRFTVVRVASRLDISRRTKTIETYNTQPEIGGVTLYAVLEQLTSMGFRYFLIGLVDDDTRVLESFEELLVSGGYKVLPFRSAEAFLLAKGLQEVDCLISDIEMHAMSGRELLRIAQTERPDLPVILITARDEGRPREGTEKMGARYLFIKPFEGKELLTALRAILEPE